MEANTQAERAAEQQISRRVTYAINGGYIDEVRRLQYSRRAKEVLL
ncbi:hypothetical protein [Cupriavidus sp. H18C1]